MIMPMMPPGGTEDVVQPFLDLEEAAQSRAEDHAPTFTRSTLPDPVRGKSAQTMISRGIM